MCYQDHVMPGTPPNLPAQVFTENQFGPDVYPVYRARTLRPVDDSADSVTIREKLKGRSSDDQRTTAPLFRRSGAAVKS